MGNNRGRKARQIAARQVRRDLAAIESRNCHQQRQCPLFGRLPPELRNLIFEYALREEPDLTRRYQYGLFNVETFQLSAYVPRLHVDLLRTCRLIYRETRAIPLRNHSINSFYPYVEIHTVQPGTSKCCIRMKSPFRFDQLTKTQQRQLQEVHIITRELRYGMIDHVLSLQQFTPRRLNLVLGWTSIKGKYATLAALVRKTRYNEQLELLRVRVVDLGSSKADMLAHIGGWQEWDLMRKDGRLLKLVHAAFVDSGTCSLKTEDISWCRGFFIWQLETATVT